MSDNKIIRLNKYINIDTIEVCEAIIAKAKRGEITGMIFAIQEGLNDHGIGATGAYRENPLNGKLVVGGLFDLFSELARPLAVDCGKLV
jgi:hypothetical protein